jgi:acyl-coenzyme A thioesterase PaaI-like protein
VNLLAPASGETLVARGQLLKTGKTLTVCRGEAFSADDGPRRLVAAMRATMMSVRVRHGVKD